MALPTFGAIRKAIDDARPEFQKYVPLDTREQAIRDAALRNLDAVATILYCPQTLSPFDPPPSFGKHPRRPAAARGKGKTGGKNKKT